MAVAFIAYRNPYWTHLAAKQLGYDKLGLVQCDRAWLRSQLGLIERKFDG
ncbi:hypothetical protein [Nostoc sp.]